jgi:tetratricopeptide (TPR) repeat protein
MTVRGHLVVLVLVLGLSRAAAGQSAAASLALGDSALAVLDVPRALEHYEAAVAAEPRNYEALWKSARVAVDLGDEMTDRAARTRLYERATGYARRAVQANPEDAEAHFHLARSLGVAALTMGVRDRVKYATEVRAEALRALELDPRHPGALHVLGVWNAEVMRLNRFERVIARTFLGGGVFGSASWGDAVRHLEQAVAIDPGRLTHRLDLARIYRDTGEKAKAREQYEAVINGAATEYGDPRFKREATEELSRIR